MHFVGYVTLVLKCISRWQCSCSGKRITPLIVTSGKSIIVVQRADVWIDGRQLVLSFYSAASTKFIFVLARAGTQYNIQCKEAVVLFATAPPGLDYSTAIVSHNLTAQPRIRRRCLHPMCPTQSCTFCHFRDLTTNFVFDLMLWTDVRKSTIFVRSYTFCKLMNEKGKCTTCLQLLKLQIFR